LSVKTSHGRDWRAERGRGGRSGTRFDQAPRIEIVADDPTLTPFAGSAVVGELVRRLGLIPALDRAIEGAPRVGGLGPVKQRARGLSAGQALVCVAESMLCGGDSMLDVERLRADVPGAELRAVADAPAASTACQLARRFRRTHLRAGEEALATVANEFDRQLGRDVSEAVTLDFDSTSVEVYGRRKPGASVNYKGQLAYQPLLCSWAGRGRMLAGELLSGTDSTQADEPRRLLARAVSYLPEGHGEISARFDTGFYRVDLLHDCRERGVRFSISVPRSKAMWRALENIAEEQWRDAQELPDAQVAESTYAPHGWEHEPLRLIIRRVAHPAHALSDDPRARRRATIPAEQLNLGLTGEADVVYGYSFILTDLQGEAPAVERHHRERAQIEERIKDQKLGVSLRRLPLSDLDGNRFWLTCTALALNLLALLNDLLFGSDPPGHLPRRRQAKWLRRMLLCVPARVIRHARRIRLRLPAGIPQAELFARAYSTARGLAPPAAA
jgi:Transposase DDE domain group 1